MATKTYGTVSLERQRAMSGLEFVKGLAVGELPLNTIAEWPSAIDWVAIALISTGVYLVSGGPLPGQPS